MTPVLNIIDIFDQFQCLIQQSLLDSDTETQNRLDMGVVFLCQMERE